MSNTSRRDIWVPSPAIILHQLQSTEDVADESALEYHESCNQAWRAQYKHPVMARMGVGFEFVNSTSRYMSSLISTQDDDTENHVIGNSSSSTNRLGPTLRIPHVEIQPYSFGSDDENLIQHLA
ncbi:uncharacterized protein LOC122617426 isoform X1 [Drosophila teissieri]|uniref:Uncharacterized protein, isoform A n=1 Tax=Drosophila yakuba TaxID=7245 RepID=B4PHJ6_DROYA|nr:uncharacterized protein LOC6535064 isoform X1 [Drosophila yakuba]XP_043649212.1 uncharacterized protein LOC122617426 isoform X1 [Drosophila teissieri]EDW95434.1 uncharacterized protein Dyak_GE22562, isoform A [Drosophila yakuba]EDW95440.1 uncharacterized protein Dyak_GE22566, isoform A [Drosophila yakuba]